VEESPLAADPEFEPGAELADEKAKAQKINKSVGRE
jgi:hypothetical protein